MLAERIAKKLPLCGCSGTLVQNLLRTLLRGKDPAHAIHDDATGNHMLISALLLLRRTMPGRCTSRSTWWWIGGGFRPAVVDYHRFRVNTFMLIVNKCLICQGRRQSTSKACRLLYHRASA
jgi:hypothetical protein